MMRRVLVALVLAGMVASLSYGQDLKTIVGLRNFLWVNTEVCTAGQPTAAHLRELKRQGVKAVLNLRQPSEHDAEGESALVRKLGLKYFNIPVDGRNLRDEQVDGFLRIAADPDNRPIFIHCGSANRVGAFWMIKRAVADGWAVERAEVEARRIGMRSPALVEFARDYIRRYGEKQAMEKAAEE